MIWKKKVLSPLANNLNSIILDYRWDIGLIIFSLVVHWYSFFLYLLSYCYCTKGTLWHLQSSYICHSWIHLLHHSPLSPLPHSCNSFIRSHFSIFIPVYTVFAPYSPSYTLSLYPLPCTRTNSQTGPVLPSCSLFLKKKKRHFCLLKVALQVV
jgi:hypothetical protein